MRELFQQELQELRDGLVEISEKVSSATERAVSAFNNSDVAVAACEFELFLNDGALEFGPSNEVFDLVNGDFTVFDNAQFHSSTGGAEDLIVLIEH